MNTGKDMPWREVFCGREHELGTLMKAWKRVVEQKRPELIVIVGESGLGKTRLVQEFFGRLSTRVDAAGKEGYWPDRLTREVNNLRINPDPAACQFANRDRMGFLWWGIRLTDPIGRNASLGGLSEGVEILRPHLDSFARARMLIKRKSTLGKTVATDLALEIGNLFTFGLLGIGKTSFEHLQNWQEINEAEQSINNVDPGAAKQTTRDTLVDLVIADLAALFGDDDRKGAPLPAVILLDDAQWLHGDETTRTFVERLLRRARAQSWPLLIIATHWEKEWLEDQSTANSTFFPEIARAFGGEKWKPMKLGKEPSLASMVSCGFPGLTSMQTALILNKADGNPRLLDEILHYLMRSKGLFDSADRTAALTVQGEKKLRAKSLSLHGLVAERLADAPEQVRAAVGISGIQGVRFLTRVTANAADALGQDAIADGLSSAEHPYAMVARIDDGLSEFAQRVYREVALEQLTDVMDEVDARRALREALLALAGPTAAFDNLTEHERQAAWVIGTELFLSRVAEKEDLSSAVAAWCFARAIEAETARYGFLSAGWLAKTFAAEMREGNVDDSALPVANLLRLGDASWEASDFETAEYIYTAALAHAQSRAEDPGDPPINMIWCLSKAGAIEEALRGPKSALPFYQNALTLSRCLPNAPEYREKLAFALEKCGETEVEISQSEATLSFYEEALSIRRAEAEKCSARITRRNLARCLLTTARAHWMVYGPAAAQPFADDARDIFRALVGERDDPEAQRDLAFSLRQTGQIYMHVAGPHAGMVFNEEALHIDRSLADALDTPRAKHELCLDLKLIGVMTAQILGAKAALPFCKEALAIARGLANELQDLESWRTLSLALSRNGDLIGELYGPERAIPFHEETLAIARTTFKQKNTVRSRSGLIYCCVKLGDMVARTTVPDQASPLYEEALDNARTVVENLTTPLTLRRLGYCLLRVGDVRARSADYSSASSLYAEALRIFRNVANTTSSAFALRDVSYSLLRVADNQNYSFKPGEALPFSEEAVRINRMIVRQIDTQKTQYSLAVSLIKLGGTEARLERPSDAYSRYDEARAILSVLAGEFGTARERRGLETKPGNADSSFSQVYGPQTAIPLYEDALNISSLLAGSIEKRTAFKCLADALRKMGDIHANVGAYNASRDLYKEARLTLSKINGEFSADELALQKSIEDSFTAIEARSSQ